MEFVLPHSQTTHGELCAHYSQFYCFVNLKIDLAQSRRKGKDSDKNRFKELVRPLYKQLNWFSLSYTDRDSEGCCTRQRVLYEVNGQRKGLSPEKYLEKVSDFRGYNKRLIYIKTRYEPLICKNIITGLGFGQTFTGFISILGDHHAEFGYLFPSGDQIIREFKSENIEDILTFDWFKWNIMCEEQPWICQLDSDESVDSNESDPNSQRRRLI
ncbi:uncharacterized protein LOC134856828 [Symsagittifera roscoffensis]|uniref:uncharacterized protein LOC134856828 n=1 Tax=Symsagittifera roscoffensis TaxID=84072 RepID=UPI00307BCCE1